MMIIGFLPVVPEKNKIYDYSACTYPEGLIASDINFVFDNNQIEEILFKGFENDEEKNFKEQVKKFIEENPDKFSGVSSPTDSVADQPAPVQPSVAEPVQNPATSVPNIDQTKPQLDTLDLN